MAGEVARLAPVDGAPVSPHPIQISPVHTSGLEEGSCRCHGSRQPFAAARFAPKLPPTAHTGSTTRLLNGRPRTLDYA
jgi:hypothetical protein